MICVVLIVSPLSIVKDVDAIDSKNYLSTEITESIRLLVNIKSVESLRKIGRNYRGH